MMSSTIPLVFLYHTLNYSHGLIHAILQSIKIDSFIDLTFQDLASILIEIIEYYCPSWAVI